MNEDDIVQTILVPDEPGITVAWAYYTAIRACIVSYMNRHKDKSPYWDEWLAGRFTKTVRKYPLNKLKELQALPEVAKSCLATVALGVNIGKEFPVIVLPPATYAQMPKVARKCQVQGINYNYPVGQYWPSEEEVIAYKSKYPSQWRLHINAALGMSDGKTIAQLCHAALMTWILYEEPKLISNNTVFTTVSTYKYLITTNPEIYDKVETDLIIQDAGFTEVEPGTTTVKIELPVGYYE